MNLESFKKKYAEMHKAQKKMACAKMELRRLNAQKEKLNQKLRTQKLLYIGECFVNFWDYDLLDEDFDHIRDLMSRLFLK